jgi:hypothetical protein
MPDDQAEAVERMVREDEALEPRIDAEARATAHALIQGYFAAPITRSSTCRASIRRWCRRLRQRVNRGRPVAGATTFRLSSGYDARRGSRGGNFATSHGQCFSTSPRISSSITSISVSSNEAPDLLKLL